MTDGRLVLVATPIGNLGDLSERAREALAGADVIACEDTRRTGSLLTRIGIEAAGRLRAVHEHNEAEAAARIVAEIVTGAVVAYATDAGTPGISDPGARLVLACIEAGAPVEAVPGPSALIAALVVSGLPTSRFRFEGFLPRRGAERARRLGAIAESEDTVVIFEAPRRVHATLAELAKKCGGSRPAAVVRELTKLHEEHWRGELSELAERASTTSARGEFVIVVGAAEPAAVTDDEIRAAVSAAMAAGATTRDATAQVCAQLGVARGRAYDAALAIKNLGGTRDR